MFGILNVIVVIKEYRYMSCHVRTQFSVVHSVFIFVCAFGKPFWCIVNHPGQLSLGSLLVGAVSTSESWGIKRHTTRCTNPVFVVL